MDLQALRKSMANMTKAQLELKYEDAQSEIEYWQNRYKRMAKDNDELLAKLGSKAGKHE